MNDYTVADDAHDNWRLHTWWGVLRGRTALQSVTTAESVTTLGWQSAAILFDDAATTNMRDVS